MWLMHAGRAAAAGQQARWQPEGNGMWVFRSVRTLVIIREGPPLFVMTHTSTQPHPPSDGLRASTDPDTHPEPADRGVDDVPQQGVRQSHATNVEPSCPLVAVDVQGVPQHVLHRQQQHGRGRTSGLAGWPSRRRGRVGRSLAKHLPNWAKLQAGWGWRGGLTHSNNCEL